MGTMNIEYNESNFNEYQMMRIKLGLLKDLDIIYIHQ